MPGYIQYNIRKTWYLVASVLSITEYYDYKLAHQYSNFLNIVTIYYKLIK